VPTIELHELGLRSPDHGEEQRDQDQKPDRQGSPEYSGVLRHTRVRRVARAFVGLGSNLGDREATLRAAVGRLRGLAGAEVRKVSRFRDTEPVGYLDQPRFLNGAVELETTLSPQALLAALLELERTFGRDRAASPLQGPRTLDLDLLLYGEETIAEPGLEVPHPRLQERRFVLEPLAELDPALVVPGHGPVEVLLAELHSAP
jgi:2-amino-4-hydroxy-6-hydroxymethyldihydropteridine diphosphokinase